MEIKITSAAFREAEMIPPKYACDGQDISPPLAWRGLGLASSEAGKLDDAVAAWEKAGITDPSDAFSTYNLGLAYFKKGDKVRARSCFQKYLALKGDKISPEERDNVLALIEKCKY